MEEASIVFTVDSGEVRERGVGRKGERVSQRSDTREKPEV